MEIPATQKLLPDESDDNEEAEEKMETSVWFIELAIWFLSERVIVGFSQHL